MASVIFSTDVNYWYHNDTPEVGDIITCIVSSYGEAGYTVLLEAYDNREGFIPLCELSQKRIRKNPATFLKIGDRHPVQVMSIAEDDSHVVEVSLKDVNQSEQERCFRDAQYTAKMYNMCKRLEHVTGTSGDVWEKSFKDAISKHRSATDLFEAVHSEQKLREGDVDLPEELQRLLVTHHVQLFGFSTATVHKNYLIQCFRSDGNEYVKRVLLGICPQDQKIWSNEELNQDHTRYNLSVKLVGLPKILITVSSVNRELAEEIQTAAEGKLKAANFNILMAA